METSNMNQETGVISELVYCRGCGEKIHKEASACPKCGAPQINKNGKSKVVAALLAFFLGAFGIHRFYLGQVWGLVYLLFCWTGIPSIVSFIETIVFLLSNQQRWDQKYNDGVPSANDSSTVIVVILLVIFFFVGIAMLGIIAAVAIPSYQDYTARAQVTEAVSLSASYKAELAEYYYDHGSFTNVTIEDFNNVTSGKYVADIRFYSELPAHISIISTFKNVDVNSNIRGMEFRMATEDGGLSWFCGHTMSSHLIGDNHVQAKYLPGACR